MRRPHGGGLACQKQASTAGNAQPDHGVVCLRSLARVGLTGIDAKEKGRISNL
jgi:hypothetical protein